MRNIKLILASLVVITAICCNDHRSKAQAKTNDSIYFQQIDTAKIDSFFKDHTDLRMYSEDLKSLYRRHYKYLWHDENLRLTEIASVLYNQLNNLKNEGIFVAIPYRNEIESLLYSNTGKTDSSSSDFLLSSLYLYYLDHVYGGLKSDKVLATQWFLPRKDSSYQGLLDSLARNDAHLFGKRPKHYRQYDHLQKALIRYLDIEKKGGFPRIDADANKPVIKFNDASPTVKSVRERLFLEGYLSHDSRSDVFDKTLLEALSDYQARNSKNADSTITASLINDLNVPIAERIRTIAVNMERCRWISPDFNNASDFIAVNIPSYRLYYFRGGWQKLSSRVVVGKELNKTVVFSGEISQIVFYPYWYVPESIIENEIRPAIRKNANYLADNHMEWVGEHLRQRPGPHNSLGLVKFLFPNSNNIYLHDTPSKSLFGKEQRAFSHGCIRVERARELAAELAADDSGWPSAKVDERMAGPDKTVLNLKTKIPIYIAYFTAWADENGVVAFFPDIYKRDEQLAELLHYK